MRGLWVLIGVCLVALVIYAGFVTYNKIHIALRRRKSRNLLAQIKQERQELETLERSLTSSVDLGINVSITSYHDLIELQTEKLNNLIQQHNDLGWID